MAADFELLSFGACSNIVSEEWRASAQAFARLSAVYGGTYMLSKPDAQVVFDDAGKATGVTSEGETVQAKFVVGDPSAPRPPSACRSSQMSLC